MTSALNQLQRFLASFARRAAIAAVGIGATILSACAVAPLQEMSDARQALQSARDIGAEKYAPQQLNAAAADLSDAERLLGEGEGQYSAARSKALASKQAAITARELSMALSRAKQSLTQAGASGLDTARWQSELDAALADAENGKSDEALKKARSLTESIDTAIAGASTR